MLTKILEIFFKDWGNFLLLAFVMSSAIIVFLGFLKPLLFNKIPNKNLRKSALGLASIALSFASVAVAFWVKAWNFDYYVWTSVFFSMWTIVTYWLYETSNLRTLIHKVGSFFIAKIFGVDFTKGSIKKELETAIKDTKTFAKKEVKHDKDLNNL